MVNFLSLWPIWIMHSITLRIPNGILPLASFLIFFTASILLDTLDDLFWLHSILKQICYHGRWLDLGCWHPSLVFSAHSLLKHLRSLSLIILPHWNWHRITLSKILLRIHMWRSLHRILRVHHMAVILNSLSWILAFLIVFVAHLIINFIIFPNLVDLSSCF